MQWELMLFAGTAAAVSAGCLIPSRWLPRLPNDKLLHFLAYAVLALLAGQIADSRMEWVLWLVGLFFASWAIEGLQNWVPERKFCWRDLGANAAGLLFAVLCSPHISIFG